MNLKIKQKVLIGNLEIKKLKQQTTREVVTKKEHIPYLRVSNKIQSQQSMR